jgi:hypothetical protein
MKGLLLIFCLVGLTACEFDFGVTIDDKWENKAEQEIARELGHL